MGEGVVGFNPLLMNSFGWHVVLISEKVCVSAKLHKGLRNTQNCLHISANGQALCTNSVIHENCSCMCVLAEIIISNI